MRAALLFVGPLVEVTTADGSSGEVTTCLYTRFSVSHPQRLQKRASNAPCTLARRYRDIACGRAVHDLRGGGLYSHILSGDG